MKLDMILYGLAAIGVILTALGRRLLIIEAASFSTGWSWAIRLLPLADVMFLARFWDSAKTGAFMSLAGLVFLAPLGGKTLWEREHPKPIDTTATYGRMDGDQKNGLYISIKAEHDARVQAKQRKLERLNAHLAAWYQSMEQRRAALATATGEEVAAFNDEAACYTSLRDVSKREADALQILLSRKLEGWGSISDDEYVAYLRKQHEHPHSIKALFHPKHGGNRAPEPGADL